jgi:class 3 adenylate cyclase
VGSSELKQRLAAILAADVAGYSRLMAAAERATVAALDAARSTFKSQIESNQGRVIDMAGDSVLAVFESATGAVSAAVAVQRELNASSSSMPKDRRMRFRIGVHMGEVIEKSDGTVYGDGVNIAARLQQLAEPGGITVSAAVQSAVRGKVTASFVDLGERRLKNIAEPVTVSGIRVAGVEPVKLSIRKKAVLIVAFVGVLAIGAGVYYVRRPSDEERGKFQQTLLVAQAEKAAEEKALAEKQEVASLERKKQDAARLAAERARIEAERATAERLKQEAMQAAAQAKLAEASRAEPAAAAPSSTSHDQYRVAAGLEAEGKGKEAVRAYIQAARGGNCEAAKRLGDIYDAGLLGVSRDYAESLKWYNFSRTLGCEVPLRARQ